MPCRVPWWCLLCLAVPWTGGCERECRLDVDCPASTVCEGGRCRTVEPADADADADADVDADADADEDAEVGPDADEGAPPEELPVLALHSATFVPDRVCDVNGDGVADNAFRSFPPTVLGLLGRMLSWQQLFMLDLGEIVDPATPHGEDFPVEILRALDCDRDPGNVAAPGQVYGNPALLDSGPASALDGAFELTVESVSVLVTDDEVPVEVRGFRLTGRLAPWLATLTEGLMCGYVPARQLHSIPFELDPRYSILEVMLSPGRWLGMPELDGVQPDIDADGDGLEVFVTDRDGRVALCLDGDGSVVEPEPGRSCAEHPRMADGLSVTLAVEGVAALLRATCPPADG